MGTKKMYGKMALVSLACAATFAAGSAQAALDLNAQTGGLVYSTEIAVDATNGTAILNDAASLTADVHLGFGVSANTSIYVRFELGAGAKFVASPTCALTGDNGVLSAGGIGESYAIFSIVAAAGAKASTDHVVLTPTAAGLKVFNENTITITYTMYSTPGDAVNKTNALATTSMNLATWSTGKTGTVTAITPSQIDVTNNSVQFVDTINGNKLTNRIGQVDINKVAARLWTDGQAVAMIDLVSAGTHLDITGDFTACQNLTGGVPNGTYTVAALNRVYIDNHDACVTVRVPATAVGPTSATLTLDQNAVTGNDQICMVVNGVSTIVDGSYTALYDVTVPAASDLTDQSLGTISTFTKNGSTEVKNLALTPNGAYRNYVRISNTSSIGGRVYITVYKDDGTSATKNLSDVAGQTSNTLAAQSSTSLMNINDIYTAAFGSAAYTGKLRLSITGEFSSIDAQSITVSTDNTSFSTF